MGINMKKKMGKDTENERGKDIKNEMRKDIEKDIETGGIDVITTIPPYAPYIKEVCSHDIVRGARINTVMQLKESIPELLERLASEIQGKKLWIDLKCRQIRTTNYATTPFHYLEISHDIEVETPVDAWFNDGLEVATIAKIDGRKLIMLDGPQRVVGPGESLNILDPSLKIKGYLTEGDKAYIQAARQQGIHSYMLSYVEQESDITDVLELDPDAEIVAKIESPKGLEFVQESYKRYKENVRLMAARGDLYVEVVRPHKILKALKDVIKADPAAIAASRIFPSLRNSPVPSCTDITDIGFLQEIGYRRFMIGDDICFNRDSLVSCVNLMQAIKDDYR